ncbi:hypothetical protein Chor_016884 [Crotalus horridus]
MNWKLMALAVLIWMNAASQNFSASMNVLISQVATTVSARLATFLLRTLGVKMNIVENADHRSTLAIKATKHLSTLSSQCLSTTISKKTNVNECEVGNHTCNVQQTCFNFQGGFKCLDPVRCEDPYIRINEKDQPFTILYRDMDVSGRTVPSDVFQMQATSRYPGAYYIFQIKSGNEGREFYMRQTGPISATLVMTRPLKGPRDIVLDLEMVTVNTVINFRGSSVIRLRIYVSQYPF